MQWKQPCRDWEPRVYTLTSATSVWWVQGHSRRWPACCMDKGSTVRTSSTLKRLPFTQSAFLETLRASATLKKDSDSTQEGSSQCSQARFWGAVLGATFVSGRHRMIEGLKTKGLFTQQSKKDRNSRGQTLLPCLTQPPTPCFCPPFLPHPRERGDREMPASWGGNDSDTNADVWGFPHTKKFCDISWRSYN